MEEFNEKNGSLSPEEITPAADPSQEQPAVGAETDEALPQPAERVPVCDVQFRAGGKIYFFDPNGLDLKSGDHVIIDTARGAEYGYCVLGTHRVAKRELVQPLRKVLRAANQNDRRIKADNERKEKEAYAFCLKKVEELGLDMQLVSAECAFDGSKLLFFFTADARVDFRELVKILASNYHTRIELRQIGVRDKAKMLGGLGICGRPFCCASFLDDFEPVSIKMAKTQNLSLNPTKISGTCGRLMCCLKYEQEAYEDLIKTSPKPESFVDTPGGRGTVTAVNLMRQSVSVRMENDPEEVHSFRNSEICVLRSGKARKTDPPIPEDLAPISGRQDPEAALFSRLDRRLALSAEEAEAARAAEPEPAEEKQSRRKQEKPAKPEQPAEQPEQESAAQPEQPEQPEQPAEKAPETDRRNESRKNRNKKAPKLQEPVPKAAQEASDKQNKGRQKKQNQGQTNQPRSRQEKKQASAQKAQPAPAPKVPSAPAPKTQPVPVQSENQAAKPETAKKNNRGRFYYHRKNKGGGKG